MKRFTDGPVVEVSTVIDAPPETVWDLVTDIDLPARFQDEFRGAEWLDGAGPGPDAAFRGRNQRGDRKWETTSYVVAYEPGRVFGFAVDDRENPGATWTFRLEPSGAVTKLTYHRTLGPGPSGLTRAIAKYPEREEEIIAARDEIHRGNMQAVVDGIKGIAEDVR
jgi:uncharacterized protein YndB with AHSA1/START domain